MSEPVDKHKLCDMSPRTLVKTSSATGKGLFVLGFIAIGLYSIWVTVIQPHTRWAQKTQAQSITIEKGATATIVQKTEAQKRRLIPFIEVSVAQTRNARMDTAVRAGFRMEF